MTIYPEKDITLLQGWPEPITDPIVWPVGNVPNDQTNPEVDITLLPGVPGQRGPQGPKGDTGATPVIAYTHVQNAVSSTWTIIHNLSFVPNVTTTDSAGTSIEGTVTVDSPTQITITFSVALTGTAYLS